MPGLNFPFLPILDSGLKDNPAVKEMRSRIEAREKGISGCSGTIVWAESHAAQHCWTEYDFITIDLFSCKDFCVEDVINFTKGYWRAEKIVYRVINRYVDKNIVSEDIIVYE